MDILSVNFQLITMLEKTEKPVKQQHIHQTLNYRQSVLINFSNERLPYFGRQV